MLWKSEALSMIDRETTKTEHATREDSEQNRKLPLQENNHMQAGDEE